MAGGNLLALSQRDQASRRLGSRATCSRADREALRVGRHLMLIESEILIQALASFAHRGITALPLHDSVLVAKSEAEEARGVMADAFGLYASDARAKLKVTFS
jgi:hypothetical protein